MNIVGSCQKKTIIYATFPYLNKIGQNEFANPVISIPFHDKGSPDVTELPLS